MLSKILFVSNTANFSKFNLPFMDWFTKLGWQVDYASSGEEPIPFCNNQFQISLNRSPFALQNIFAYRQMKNIIDINNYDIVHCHTPMGGVIARLAARHSRKNGTKVIYTAHGFHFFTGAPIFNWLLFYPVEKLLANYTDCLVTINNEDYSRVIHNKFRVPLIYKINGVGIDLERFHPVTLEYKNNLRKRLGYKENDFILIYIAEFIPRKNHAFILNSIPVLINQIPNVKVIFAGKGELIEAMKCSAHKKKLLDYIKFVGYRKDVEKFCMISDLHISVSKQEGLSINNIEAMACGLPIVCTNIRGHRDVVIPNRNGFLINLNNKIGFVNAITELYNNTALRKQISINNVGDVQKYSVSLAVKNMTDIYKLLITSKSIESTN